MAEHNADVVIYGAGIAGLWIFNLLKQKNYDVVLLERGSIGGGQTLASQGIIHSGLKYMLSGYINDVAKGISAMPDIWTQSHAALHYIDLSAALLASPSQNMLIPKGLAGKFVKIVAKNILGTHAKAGGPLPGPIADAGFNGSLITLKEPVFDIPSVLHALAEPYKNAIRKNDEKNPVKAQKIIYTAAGGNIHPEIEMQTRPLLMGLIRNAPFPLYAHCIGLSDKPVCTITTHRDQTGALIWYIGGQVAERAKNDDPQKLFREIKDVLARYLPALDLLGCEWAAYPVDRVEPRSKTGTLPDRPVIQEKGNTLFCWPTKLTFAPLLADMVLKHLQDGNIKPSGSLTDWSFLPPVEYAQAPWDKVTWTKNA